MGGAPARGPSGGFSSRNAMYLFRGPTFVEELIKVQRRRVDRLVYRMARPSLRSQPFEELYFLKHARKVRAEVSLPLFCVGGVQSLASVHLPPNRHPAHDPVHHPVRR